MNKFYVVSKIVELPLGPLKLFYYLFIKLLLGHEFIIYFVITNRFQSKQVSTLIISISNYNNNCIFLQIAWFHISLSLLLYNLIKTKKAGFNTI